MARDSESFLINTASDPAASRLAHFLDQSGFIVQAPEDLSESARVLVDVTTKRKLNTAIREAIRNHTITKDEQKFFRIIRVT